MIYLPPQESSHSEVHTRYCSTPKPLAMAMAWKRSSGVEIRGRDDAKGGVALRFFKLENPVYSLNYRNRWSHKRMIWALAHARDEAPIRPVAKRFLIQTYLLHFPHFFPRISISEPHHRVTATTRRSRRGPTLGWRKPVAFLVIGRSRWVSSLASTVEIGLNCVGDKCENGASQWRENWRIWRRNRSFGA